MDTPDRDVHYICHFLQKVHADQSLGSMSSNDITSQVCAAFLLNARTQSQAQVMRTSNKIVKIKQIYNSKEDDLARLYKDLRNIQMEIKMNLVAVDKLEQDFAQVLEVSDDLSQSNEELKSKCFSLEEKADKKAQRVEKMKESLDVLDRQCKQVDSETAIAQEECVRLYSNIDVLLKETNCLVNTIGNHSKVLSSSMEEWRAMSLIEGEKLSNEISSFENIEKEHQWMLQKVEELNSQSEALSQEREFLKLLSINKALWQQQTKIKKPTTQSLMTSLLNIFYTNLMNNGLCNERISQTLDRFEGSNQESLKGACITAAVISACELLK